MSFLSCSAKLYHQWVNTKVGTKVLKKTFSSRPWLIIELHYKTTQAIPSGRVTGISRGFYSKKPKFLFCSILKLKLKNHYSFTVLWLNGMKEGLNGIIQMWNVVKFLCPPGHTMEPTLILVKTTIVRRTSSVLPAVFKAKWILECSVLDCWQPGEITNYLVVMVTLKKRDI